MKLSETSSSVAKGFSKGMVKDLSDDYLDEGVWTHAINVTTNTHKGEKGHISNEPSNTFCTSLPYTYIGSSRIHGTKEWIVFSTDDVNSEIGLFEENTCKYKRVVNDPCLNFKRSNLIHAVNKRNYDTTISVFFVDGLNPDRHLNLDKIPYKTTGRNLSEDKTCFIPEYTKDLDCDQLLLNSKLIVPVVKINRSLGAGQLLNGSYQAVVAYSTNGIRITDYFTPSVAQPLWSEEGSGLALDITIDRLDQRFDEYELVIIGIVNQQTVVKKIGYYSTAQNRVTLSQVPESLPTVDIALIPLQNPLYLKSDKIYTLNDYLLRQGVHIHPEINYQIQANNISTKWIEVEYPSSYYYLGGNNVGYMRDEVYSFFIRWIYNTGHKTASFHIPGRNIVSDELSRVSGKNVLKGELYKWETADTSTKTIVNDVLPDGGIVKAKGLMSYWESSEKYDNDTPQIWGDLCGKNIRHHKMPSNFTSPIYATKGDKIRILGVQFENITHPKDKDGFPIKDIVGYEILRGSREGNRSIVAKGIFNNLRVYEAKGIDKKILYQNYPLNDLNPDKYLIKHIPLSKPDVDDDILPLSEYKKDHMSFHSPDTTFFKPFLGGAYAAIYSEESGEVSSKFSTPYKHPKEKLITNTAFASAAVIGVSIGLLSALGKTTSTNEAEGGINFIIKAGGGHSGSRESGTLSVIPDLANAFFASPFATAATMVFIASQAAFIGSQGIQQALDILYHMVQPRQYALQCDSACFYNKSYPTYIRKDIALDGAKYVGTGVQDFNDQYKINNMFRNKYVALKFDTIVEDPVTKDNSRVRVQDLKTWKNPFDPFTRTSSTQYGALKIQYKNQYGQIENINQIPTGSGWFAVEPIEGTFVSDVIFGGDVYINRYTEKNPFCFFNDWLFDKPDETEFNYVNYINGPNPRYWANFEKYDVSDIGFKKDEEAKKLFKEIEKEGRDEKFKSRQFVTPSSMHSLDKNGGESGGLFSIRDAFFYLFNNGIREFYVESEMNLAYREQGLQENQKHFNTYAGYTDINTLFRSDLIKEPELFKYDNSLSSSKLYNNFIKWGSVLPRDYDPLTQSSKNTYLYDRVIYSLQHKSGLKKDNWMSFLANNYRDFNAKITTIKSMNGTGALILFENREPVEFIGQDQLQTVGGTKITIGDAGLFQQGFSSVVNADDELDYGICINERSVVNTPYGLFFISQPSGKIYLFNGKSLNDISLGIKYWLADNLPSKLLKQFPNFLYPDNPILGIGCSAAYDTIFEKIYFSKKDYIPNPDKKIKYENGRFMAETGNTIVTTPGGVVIYHPIYTYIELTDTEYFTECSFTVSYDPATNTWVSFHDWYPDFSLSTPKHFYTIRDKSFWYHNNTNTSYCNFYGVNYPWEIEIPYATIGAITTLRSVEYYLDCTKNIGSDEFQLLDYNFDEAIIYNTEQVSGILKLNNTPKHNPVTSLSFPKINTNNIDILYSKEENKYRFNQFWDITRDRGEFSFTQQPIFITAPNGYNRLLNSVNLDYNKAPLERKKFRHYKNKLILRKLLSNNIKMQLKIVSLKNLLSQR